MHLTSTNRYGAIDAYRGLIMIVMALDHASALIARQHGSEFWSGAMSAYTAAFPFLTRWITHLCAPGFFFLMGAGIYWFATGRRAAGWTESAISRRIVLRGFVILALGQLFETALFFSLGYLSPPAITLNQVTAPPPNDGTTPYFALITLSGLGLVMMVSGFLLRLRPWAWLLVAALCVIVTNSLLPASGKPGPWWATILLIPGLSDHLIGMYPVIPWLAGTVAGMYFGHWWRGNPDRAANRVWIVGVALLGVSIATRAADGWGNIRAARDSGWIEFLNNVKYPPSLVFWTMSLGLGLILIGVLIRAPRFLKSESSPLIVFGQTPLFFYLMHFAILTACAFAFFREAASLEGAYVMWVLVVATLYPICARFRKLQLSKPANSLLRLF